MAFVASAQCPPHIVVRLFFGAHCADALADEQRNDDCESRHQNAINKSHINPSCWL